jgi:hypothetical protein
MECPHFRYPYRPWSIFVIITKGTLLSPYTREFQAAACTPYADAAILRAGKALAFTGYYVLSDGTFRGAAWEEFKQGS